MTDIISKEKFSRRQLHDTMMKQVIIRLDYSGITDLDDLVKKISDIERNFSKRTVVYNNQMNVNLRPEDIESISQSLSIPVNVIRKDKLIRYSGFNRGNCDITLDVSQFFTCLTIYCDNNYDGLDNYIDVFVSSINKFRENKFLDPKRLGLRKTRVQYMEEVVDINKTYEDSVFCLHFFNEAEKFLYKKYFDTTKQNDIQVNIIREINLVEKDEKLQYQTSLDIDAYYQFNEQEPETIVSQKSIPKLLDLANNYEFEIYKRCMTQTYLNSIYHE